MRAAIAARVSLDPRGQGRSVAEQESESRAWAEREGWEVVEVIHETGSASRYGRSTKARQGWNDIVALVASGRIDILLSWEHSRASRQLETYTELRNLCEKHGVLWGYTGTVYDFSKRDARFRTGLDALVAEDESARISERTQRASRARAAAGRPHGKLPYGYRREYDPTSGALLRQVPDDPRVEDGVEIAGTAPIVREIIRRVAAGETLYAIAADLTRRQVPLPRPPTKRHDDAAWIPMTVKRIATSPTYAGKRVHRGQVVGEAQWEPLVDEVTSQRAKAAVERMRQAAPRVDRSVKWLLSGIARCGVCDGPMVHHVNRGTSSYLCKYCMRVSRRREPVDEFVVARLLELLTVLDVPGRDSGASPEVLEAETAVRELNDRRDALVLQAADGSISPALLARIEAELTPRIEAAERRARALRRPPVLDGVDLRDPVAMWEGSDLARRRTLLAGLLEVRILPAGRGHRTFDESLIQVRPRW